jgi:hypothetical protein
MYTRYMELDINLYDRCSREHNEKERTKSDLRTAATAKWLSIAEAASAKGVVCVE